VECDGATYHRSATARDRDRLREMVLNGLGWKIRRIWSTEWWMDAAAATDKIHARLTADLDADRASRVAGQKPEEPTAPLDDVAMVPSSPPSADPAPARPPTAILTEPPVIPPEPANDPEPIEEPKVYARGPDPIGANTAAVSSYAKADPSIVVVPDRERFYDVGYRSDLRAMIDHVVAVEGPVYFDILVDRIARAHGFQRSGETVQKIIRAALGRNRFPSTRDDDREIIWPQNTVTSDKTLYRGAGGREHSDIPLAELAGLADILRSRGLEDDEDLIRGMQDHFDLGRLATSTRQRFEAAINPIPR
jgi:hypothetical protein